MRYNFLIILILLTTTSQVIGQQKVGTTSFQFLKVKPDARSTAMGDAVSTFVNTSEAVYVNPAGLVDINKIDASISFFEYFFDVKTTALSCAYSIPGIGTLGLQAMFTSYGEMEITTVDALGFQGDVFNPGLTGETYSPTNMVVGLSYARQLTDKFSFGLTSKYVSENLDFQSNYDVAGADDHIKPTALLFDGGLIYRTGFRTLQTSVVIRHFGGDIMYVNEKFPPPQTLTLGIAGYLFSPDNALISQMTTNQSLLLTADLVAPRDYDQQYNVGLEYGISDFLFLRAGYKINYDTESWSCGAGVNFNKFRGDYSVVDYGNFLGMIHRFSLGFSID